MSRLAHRRVMLHFIHHAGERLIIAMGCCRQITQDAVEQLLYALPLFALEKDTGNNALSAVPVRRASSSRSGSTNVSSM